MGVLLLILYSLIICSYKDLINKMQEQLNLKEIPPVTKPLEADPQYKLIVELSGVGNK